MLDSISQYRIQVQKVKTQKHKNCAFANANLCSIIQKHNTCALWSADWTSALPAETPSQEKLSLSSFKWIASYASNSGETTVVIQDTGCPGKDSAEMKGRIPPHSLPKSPPHLPNPTNLPLASRPMPQWLMFLQPKVGCCWKMADNNMWGASETWRNRGKGGVHSLLGNGEPLLPKLQAQSSTKVFFLMWQVSNLGVGTDFWEGRSLMIWVNVC